MRILLDGTDEEKEKYKAFIRLHQRVFSNSTFADWEKANPEDAKTLLSRYRREVALDESLSYDSIMEQGVVLSQPLEGVESESYEQAIAIISGFREELVRGGISRERAQQLSESKDYSGIEWEFDRETSSSAATNFFQMTKGLGSKTLKRFVKKDFRASANRGLEEIDIGSFPVESILWHELGHHLEYEDDRIKEAATAWRSRRATSTTPEPLGGPYDKDEMALPGRYLSPYVGKVYKHGSTEVCSMGLERFVSAEAMLEFWKQDKSHFQFIWGVVRNEVFADL